MRHGRASHSGFTQQVQVTQPVPAPAEEGWVKRPRIRVRRTPCRTRRWPAVRRPEVKDDGLQAVAEPVDHRVDVPLALRLLEGQSQRFVGATDDDGAGRSTVLPQGRARSCSFSDGLVVVGAGCAGSAFTVSDWLPHAARAVAEPRPSASLTSDGSMRNQPRSGWICPISPAMRSPYAVRPGPPGRTRRARPCRHGRPRTIRRTRV